MAVTILGVPSSAGAYGPGQDGAPAALREAGLVEALCAAGLDVEDAGDVPGHVFAPDPAHPRAQGLHRVVEVATAVRERVREIVEAGRTALVLGGDCTLTLGVVAGVRAVHAEAGLAYFDGDVDLSTPDQTQSGVLDAMGIAHLLGEPDAAASLRDLVGTPLPGDQLALIGFEDGDLGPREQEILERAGAGQFPATRLRRDPAPVAREALDWLGDRPRIVHFDVDAVDSIDLPLAEFPHFNAGLSLAQATQVLRELCTGGDVVAATITEANPLRDYDGHQVARLRECLVAGWGELAGGARARQ